MNHNIHSKAQQANRNTGFYRNSENNRNHQPGCFQWNCGRFVPRQPRRDRRAAVALVASLVVVLVALAGAL